MNRPLSNLEEFRIRATRLLKELRAGSVAAAARLRHAPEWARQSPQQILAARETIRRKHALTALAREAGFADWTSLKAHLTSFDPAILFDRSHGASLNRWFKRYDEARASLDRDGGFLFPYRQHFVVCESGLLEAHGLDAGDPDWERIGRDWVRPADPRALSRLSERLHRHFLPDTQPTSV
ncbi:MAG: hypothetical protein ACKV22_27390 [Bryobacteraceae bacterium]